MNFLTIQEKEIVSQIQKETNKKNIDNISRTDAYFAYFKKNPDIPWPFLASMVSRNGGWNMCDLEGPVFSGLLKAKTRKELFLTYERANWLIFHDAFPQLMLYHYSKKLNRPLFHLMSYFYVSEFMEREWWRFWKEADRNRLTTALIINEQNVIHAPVIQHPFYQSRVFHSLIFSLQDWLHFSCVLFPTCGGEVYGASVNGFRTLSKRIDLGKRLASILFHPGLFPSFFEFANRTAHTGSRYDYEQYFSIKTDRNTPMLRNTFPVIHHHQHIHNDWSLQRKVSPVWLYFPARHRHPIHLTDWYYKKSHQLQLLATLQKVLPINL